MSKSETSSAWILVGLLSLPFAMWWNGFAVATLWGWYAVPLGAKAIGAWFASGLCVLVRLSAWKGGDRKKDDREEHPLWVAIVANFLVPALGLAAGWVFLWASQL